MSRMIALKFDNVSFAYPVGENETKNNAVNKLSFEIEEGQFVVLVGHNGSGKSTVAKLCNGLLQPSLGEVSVFGISTNDSKKLLEIRKNIGVVFQNPDNQMVATIVEDDVAFGPENVGIPSKEIRSRVNFALKQVDMSQYAEQSATRLSGGQKQRVAIAGVLALIPKIIIFDESTAMLDPKGRSQILEIAHKLNKEMNITIVHITHLVEESVSADKIFVLNGGNLVLQGTPREVFSQAEFLQNIGLDVPVATKISQSLHQKGVDIPLSLTAEELCENISRCRK